jgi:hypothetical protein
MIRPIFSLVTLVCLAAFFFTGCASYHPTERAAVVVFNDLADNVNIRFTLSGNQAPEESINSSEFKYIFEYEEDPNEPVKLPQMLTNMQIDIPPDCRISLTWGQLTDLFKRDPAGRRTWDLHINEAFVKQHGC